VGVKIVTQLEHDRLTPHGIMVHDYHPADPDRQNHRRGLGRVELRRRAVAEARRRDIQRLLLKLGVLLGLRDQHLEGSGLYRLNIKPDGTVSSVTVLKSTGHILLDRAAIHAFRQWRFRPGALRTVKAPDRL